MFISEELKTLANKFNKAGKKLYIVGGYIRNELLNIPYMYVYPTFSDAFDALIKFAGKDNFVIVIDEISFLAKSDKGFLSELQYNIDHKFKETKIKLILSGSSISFMKDVIQMFKDMFEKYGIMSAEWRCYADNKEAVKLYNHIIQEYGGVQAGYLRRNGVPQNRKICDTIVYEILRQDLCWENHKIVTKKEWNKHFNEWCDGKREV